MNEWMNGELSLHNRCRCLLGLLLNCHIAIASLTAQRKMLTSPLVPPGHLYTEPNDLAPGWMHLVTFSIWIDLDDVKAIPIPCDSYTRIAIKAPFSKLGNQIAAVQVLAHGLYNQGARTQARVARHGRSSFFSNDRLLLLLGHANPQWHTTSHPWRWLWSKRWVITSVGEFVEKSEPS